MMSDFSETEKAYYKHLKEQKEKGKIEREHRYVVRPWRVELAAWAIVGGALIWFIYRAWRWHHG